MCVNFKRNFSYLIHLFPFPVLKENKTSHNPFAPWEAVVWRWGEAAAAGAQPATPRGPGAFGAIWGAGCRALVGGTLSSDEGDAFSPRSSRASHYSWDQVLVAHEIPLHIRAPQEMVSIILAQTKAESPAG